jgi:Mitosis protein DIM1
VIIAFIVITNVNYYSGTGNNNKINWALEDKQEMIDIVETVYRYVILIENH